MSDGSVPSGPRAARRTRRRGIGGITLADVARLAGVSPITASRALNTPDKVSEEARRRVQEAVARTGYVPNRLAGGLASARSRLVAAMVPTISGPVFLETVQSLTEALAAEGYQLMLGQSGYTTLREDALLDAIIGRRPDGIVLTGVMRSPQGRRRLIASGIPVVETWDLTPTPIDMLVGFSHEAIGAAVARHLHGKGRRRPGLISGDDDRALRRNAGFLGEAARLWPGAPVPTRLMPPPTSIGDGRIGLAALLAEAPDLDAVFCNSDMIALGALIEANARKLEVPGRLSVVGMGDLAFAKDVDPPLTTVRIDGTRIGRIAARFIVDRAMGRPVEQPIVDIGFTLIERGSG